MLIKQSEAVIEICSYPLVQKKASLKHVNNKIEGIICGFKKIFTKKKKHVTFNDTITVRVLSKDFEVTSKEKILPFLIDRGAVHKPAQYSTNHRSVYAMDPEDVKEISSFGDHMEWYNRSSKKKFFNDDYSEERSKKNILRLEKKLQFVYCNRSEEFQYEIRRKLNQMRAFHDDAINHRCSKKVIF